MDGVRNKRSPFGPSRGVPCVRVQAVQNEDVSGDGWWGRRFGSGRTRLTRLQRGQMSLPVSIGGTFSTRRSPSTDNMIT